jgi:hypothetical protein
MLSVIGLLVRLEAGAIHEHKKFECERRENGEGVMATVGTPNLERGVACDSVSLDAVL